MNYTFYALSTPFFDLEGESNINLGSLYAGGVFWNQTSRERYPIRILFASSYTLHSREQCLLILF